MTDESAIQQTSGAYPQDWDQRTLGEIAQIKYGKAKPKENGDVPVVGSGGVYSYTKTPLVTYPTVVIGRKGTAGKSYLMTKPFYPSDTTFYFEWLGEVDISFIFDFLQFNPPSGEHAKTTLPSLTKSQLEAYSIPFPALSEQKKIAYILSAVREAREKTKAVIEATKQLNNSLMKYLFTYGPIPVQEAEGVEHTEIESGLIPKDWMVRLFGDCVEFLQYGTSQRCTTEPIGHPVLRIPNVLSSKIDMSDMKYTVLPQKTVEKLILKNGDILFVRTNGNRLNTGRCAVYEGTPAESLFASYLIRARTKPGVLLPKFVEYYASSEHGKAFLSGRATKAADGKHNINTQIIKQMIVPVPDLEVQQKVIEIVDGLERKIVSEQDKLYALEIIFSTLLSDLMTGKTRVNDLEIAHE